jgi:hypothetical protein
LRLQKWVVVVMVVVHGRIATESTWFLCRHELKKTNPGVSVGELGPCRRSKEKETAPPLGMDSQTTHSYKGLFFPSRI